jgi:hypothetical protein
MASGRGGKLYCSGISSDAQFTPHAYMHIFFYYIIKTYWASSFAWAGKQILQKFSIQNVRKLQHVDM